MRHLEWIPTFVACDSTPKEEHSERVDDSVITTKVKSQLAQDDFLKSFQIGVETFKGNVQLSGFVDSQKAVDKAGEINGSVKGVKSVKNRIVTPCRSRSPRNKESIIHRWDRSVDE